MKITSQEPPIYHCQCYNHALTLTNISDEGWEPVYNFGVLERLSSPKAGFINKLKAIWNIIISNENYYWDVVISYEDSQKLIKYIKAENNKFKK